MGKLFERGHYSRGDTIDWKKVLTKNIIQGGTLFEEIRKYGTLKMHCMSANEYKR